MPANDKLAKIDRKAARYAKLRGLLARAYAAFTRDVERVQERHHPKLRAALSAASDSQSELEREISAAPELFTDPRTLTLHGIRLGFMLASAGVECPRSKAAKAAVVEAIKARYTEKEIKAAGLITVTEAPNAKGLAALKKAKPDLEIPGVTFTPAGECVFIKPADHALDKLITKVLDEGKKAVGSEDSDEDAA